MTKHARTDGNRSRKATSCIPTAAELWQWYVEEQQTVQAIARRCRIRKEKVIALMEAAGIPRRPSGRQRTPLPAWDRAKLQQLASVMTRAELIAFARRHGINRIKLNVLLGLPQLPRGRLETQRLCRVQAAIRTAYEAGVSVRELAIQYQVSRRAIYYCLDRTSVADRSEPKRTQPHVMK